MAEGQQGRELVRYRVDIDAGIEVVFALLSQREGLLQWLAVEAEVDLSVGGRLSWTHANGQTVSGRFLDIEPPNRLVFSYGWEGNERVGPATTIVEVNLTAAGPNRCRLLLTHRDLPVEEQASHLEGWRYFLGLLAQSSAARNSDNS